MLFNPCKGRVRRVSVWQKQQKRKVFFKSSTSNVLFDWVLTLRSVTQETDEADDLTSCLSFWKRHFLLKRRRRHSEKFKSCFFFLETKEKSLWMKNTFNDNSKSFKWIKAKPFERKASVTSKKIHSGVLCLILHNSQCYIKMHYWKRCITGCRWGRRPCFPFFSRVLPSWGEVKGTKS